VVNQDSGSNGVAPMRFLLFLFACVAILGIGDMIFFKSRYRNEIWRDMEVQIQKINYELRRSVRF
jgi:hypothetical protein